MALENSGDSFFNEMMLWSPSLLEDESTSSKLFILVFELWKSKLALGTEEPILLVGVGLEVVAEVP